MECGHFLCATCWAGYLVRSTMPCNAVSSCTLYVV
jgi:hypothetical protein